MGVHSQQILGYCRTHQSELEVCSNVLNWAPQHLSFWCSKTGYGYYYYTGKKNISENITRKSCQPHKDCVRLQHTAVTHLEVIRLKLVLLFKCFKYWDKTGTSAEGNGWTKSSFMGLLVPTLFNGHQKQAGEQTNKGIATMIKLADIASKYC